MSNTADRGEQIEDYFDWNHFSNTPMSWCSDDQTKDLVYARQHLTTSKSTNILPGKDTCLRRFITQYLVSEKFRRVETILETILKNYF